MTAMFTSLLTLAERLWGEGSGRGPGAPHFHALLPISLIFRVSLCCFPCPHNSDKKGFILGGLKIYAGPTSLFFYGSNVDEIWGSHPHLAKGTLQLRTTWLVSIRADTELWSQGILRWAGACQSSSPCFLTLVTCLPSP